MTQHGIARITIRPQRGKLTVQAMGQTARGRKYIKHEVAIASDDLASKTGKQEVADVIKAFYDHTGDSPE